MRTSRTTRFAPHTATCPQCGNDYFKDEPWKTVCWNCYRDAHPERYATSVPRPRLTASMASDDTPEMHERILILTRQNLELKQLNEGLKTLVNMMADQMRAQAARQPAAPLDREMVRRLRYLCHPDKHNGSEASQLATKFLNGLSNDSD